MFTGAAAIVAGFGLVLAYAQLRIGMWNAYFITEKHEYGVKAHSPLTLLDTRYRQFVHPPSSWFRITTQQGALATLLVALALAVTVPGLIRARRGADRTELTLLGTAFTAWLIPYIAAGGLSIYRSEACLIVLVPLLRRLPLWEIAALVCAACGSRVPHGSAVLLQRTYMNSDAIVSSVGKARGIVTISLPSRDNCRGTCNRSQ